MYNSHYMHYIVALGNPGEEYVGTRHNVGWAAADVLVSEYQLTTPLMQSRLHGRVSEGHISEEEITLLYPETFMNHSGTAVASLVPKKKLERLIVLYDDIALPLGTIKLSTSRGDGGHNGVRSIIASLGSPDFIRVRIGIAQKSFLTGKAKRPVGARLPAFVLGHFTTREEKTLVEVLGRVQAAVEVIVTKGLPAAMNEFN